MKGHVNHGGAGASNWGPTEGSAAWEPTVTFAFGKAPSFLQGRECLLREARLGGRKQGRSCERNLRDHNGPGGGHSEDGQVLKPFTGPGS